MDTATKKQIGRRLRRKREQAGYTREKLAELSSLSPRFIANIEFGDATFSLDSLMAMCRVLSCGSDELLFGDSQDENDWTDTAERLKKIDSRYREPINQIVQGVIEMIVLAEKQS